MKILITGGAWFIGSHLVDVFQKRGEEVYIIDNLATGSRENIAHHEGNSQVRFFEADICDKEKMKVLFTDIRPDVVFHLAAEINVRHSIQNPQHCAAVNVMGTLNILDVMKSVSCQRMIFSSTGGVMFSTDNPPYRESDTPSPIDPYGISKLSGEQMIAFYARQYGINSTMLRYANVYGPRQNAKGEAGVITIFLEKIRNNETPTIFGDGNQTRDFIHVDDVISANLHVYDKQLTGVYHVGTGIETSVNELWQILANSTQTPLIPTYVPGFGEIRRWALDASKLRETGWIVQRSITEL